MSDGWVTWLILKVWLGDMADPSEPQGMFSMCITIKSSLPRTCTLVMMSEPLNDYFKVVRH